MKSKWAYVIVALLLLALAVGPGQAQGPGPQGDVGIQAVVGTAFTYQGQLKSSGNPANGNCDFQFTLYDAASGGAPVGTTQTKTNVAVSNGYFTIPDLDFDAVFQGDARWLQIAVKCTGDASYTTLTPRQALTAVPYALSLQPGAQIIGGVSGSALYAYNNQSSGYTTGVYGRSASTTGTGVLGYASANSGTTYGVYGQSASTAGTGVFGYATATSGIAVGVWGESDSADARAVYGRANATTGTTFGVFGRSQSTAGRGVFGRSQSTAGRGVYG